jgi:hypothetical protein
MVEGYSASYIVSSTEKQKENKTKIWQYTVSFLLGYYIIY